ncbi:MAG: hypothetical protein H6574_17165 [Lewinellaceae bacterium]|nr:hypothetical protein [Lewinellaceae bacterium]
MRLHANLVGQLHGWLRQCGYEVSITYTWTQDTEAPVISTTANSGDLGCNPTVVAPTFTGTDNCEGPSFQR